MTCEVQIFLGPYSETKLVSKMSVYMKEVNPQSRNSTPGATGPRTSGVAAIGHLWEG